MPNRRVIAVLVASLAALILLPSSASALKFAPGTGGTAAQVGAPSDVATGDFNGDGLDDMAVASGFSTADNHPGLNILLATGGGDFINAGTLDCNSGGSGCYSLAVGNFTGGDSDLDIFAYPYQSNSVVYSFIGNGAGGFTRISMNSPETPNQRNSVAVGDLNGNGVDDIVIGSNNGDYAIGIAQGPGSFSFTSGSIGAGNLNSATAGDFNNDNNLDIAFGDDGSHINVLLGDGGGSLTPAAGNPATVSGSTGNLRSMVTADFNGDGFDDLGVTSIVGPNDYASSVQTFLGGAGGTLTANPSPSGSAFSNITFEGTRSFSDLVTADFDADGDAGDLAYLQVFQPNGPRDYQAAIRLSNGDGSFTVAPGSPFSYQLDQNQSHNPWGQAQGDFNGDGAPDLAAADTGGGNCSGCATPVLMSRADVSTDPGSVDLGDVTLGQGSVTEGLTIKNTGAPTAHLSGFTITGPDAGQFSIDSSSLCMPTINTTCEKEISFEPTGTGAKSATLNISNADGPNLTVPLTGTGVQPQATFDPNPLEFGEVPAGTTSEARTVTVSSTGTAPLQIDQISEGAGDSGSFELVSGSDTCSNETIQPGSSCEFDVVMTPVLAFGLGYKALSISVPSNDPDSGDQQTIVTGTAINPGISLTPATYDFGEATINDGMLSHQFTVTSNGSTPLTVQDVSLTGPDAADYELGNITGCTDTPVPATQTCTFMVVFDPEYNDHATRTATLVVDSNAASGPSQSALSGTAVYPDATVDPDPAEFGEVRINQTSPVKTLTVTSSGTTAANFFDAAIFGPDAADFEIASDTCDEQIVAIGSTCEFGITMKPGTTGDKEAVLVFDTQSSDIAVELFGTGINPAGTLTPAGHDFGNVTVGTSGPSAPFTFSSTGSDPISVTSAEISGTDAGSFKLSDPTACDGTKNPGVTCDLSVTFAPEFGSSTSRSAQLTLVTSAGSFSSSLTGTAVAAPIPPTTKATIKLGAAKKVKRGKKLKVTATVKNTGTATITGLTLKTAVTKKFAKAPKAVKISSLAPGATIKRTIKVAVKKKAKAGKKLKVTVTASAAGKKLASANRTAKIKK